MQKQPLRTSEEIDLLYYMGQLREGLAKIGKIFQKYYRSLWRNKILFFLVVLLGTGAAYSLRFFIPPAYRTNGIFISHFLPADYYSIMVRDLGQLIHEENLPVLAEQLQLSTAIVSQISSIELTALRDTSLDTNDTVFAPFRISIVLKQMEQLGAIQEGILFYLEGGEAERKRKLGKRKILEEAKAIIYHQISRSDSLKGAVATKVPVSPYEQVMLYSSERAEVQELIRINEQLENQNKIEVVRPFLRRLKHNYPDYRLYMIEGFLFSLSLALIITPLMGRKKSPANS